MGRRRRRSVIALALASAMVACGGSGSDSPLPQLSDRDGPHMAHPQLVPIFYADDGDASSLTQFSRWIVASSWLAAVGEDYGVGAGEVLGVVQRTDAAPLSIDDADIVDLLYRGLADGTIPKPADGKLGEVLYELYLPAQTTVTAGSATSCLDFGGYHSAARRNGVELAYAVIATCPGLVANQTVLETRELVSSHELIEAATDPFPDNHPAFQLRDPTSPWLAVGSEAADLCTRGDQTATWHEAGFVAQRSWSNTAAADGRDPCVPADPGSPYFNVDAAIARVPRIAPGTHQSIELRGYDHGLAASDTWKLSAFPATTGEVTLTLGASTLRGDETTTLDVAVAATTGRGSTVRFFVFSDRATGYQVLPMLAIAADPCASFTGGCEACTSHIGCGFCASSGKCEAVNASGSGSDESTCGGSAFATWPGSCGQLCSTFSQSCGDCTSIPGCGWCASGTPRCVEASHDRSHPEVGSCPYEDWSVTASYCEP